MLKKANVTDSDAYKHFSKKLIEGKYGDLESELYKFFKDRTDLSLSEYDFMEILEDRTDSKRWNELVKKIKSNDQ